jgi:hypothetical protein
VRTIAIALLLVGVAQADSWAPYGQKLRISEDGKHFLVLSWPSGNGMRASFHFYERRKGTRPPREVDRKVIVDKDDWLVHSGEIEQRPLDAWMLSAPLRAVLFEEYGRVGGRTTLALLEANGSIPWKLKLRDLNFDPTKFTRTVRSTWWKRGWWVDEARRRIVLVALGEQYREVELLTGRIHKVDGSVLVKAIANPSHQVRLAALETCTDKEPKPAGWIEAARAVRDSREQSLRVRLAAAFALHVGASERPKPGFCEESLNHLDDPDVRWRSFHHVRDMFPDKALAICLAIAEGYPDWNSWQVHRAIAAQGERGIAALVEIASDPKASRQRRVAAASAIVSSNWRGRHATFARIVRTGDERFATAVLWNFLNRTNRLLAHALAEALKEPGAGDRPIAILLKRNASRKFIQALEAARDRSKPGTETHKSIDAALAACRTQLE